MSSVLLVRGARTVQKGYHKRVTGGKHDWRYQ